jgi:hypothetical protein
LRHSRGISQLRITSAAMEVGRSPSRGISIETAVNGGTIPGQRGGVKPGQLGEIADMPRGPIGPLGMSAAKKFVGYVGEISPVSGSMVCSEAG